MKLGIDLHNIRDGGGLTYVGNLMREFSPARHGFSEVVLFGAPEVLAHFPERGGVIKRAYPILSRRLPYRLAFLFFGLSRAIQREACDLLYCPGGLYFGRKRPFATISRNMMPFQPKSWKHYPWGFDRLRLILLRWAHAATFRRADGMIFLTSVAQQQITAAMGPCRGRTTVVPHGVDRSLFSRVRPVVSEPRKGAARLICPGRLEPYKHQLEVIDAVVALRAEFPELSVEFCGPENPAYGARVRAAIAAAPPGAASYVGNVPLGELARHYEAADVMVFPSSCENMPNTLIEAMEFGIPIACSDRSPMPEVAGGSCVYFDPEQPAAIAEAIRACLRDWQAAQDRVAVGRERASAYAWQRCADATFGFLKELVD